MSFSNSPTIGQPVTAVQDALARRRRFTLPLAVLVALLFVLGLVAVIVGGMAVARYTGSKVAYHPDVEAHFMYGSIGSELSSGLPYWIWRALPELFPERFEGQDYEAFGFLYETDARGNRHDLPIGLGRREVNGVEVAWFNCAVCHVGTVRVAEAGERRIVLAMPSNNLDLYGFITFLFDIAVDERLAPDSLIPAVQRAGADLGPLDRLFWRHVLIPRVREGLLARRQRLGPLLAAQPHWGPGRVDTFNPYKLIQFGWNVAELSGEERIGTADFPAIFHQGPRRDMQLHWDGNNASLQERNLSAALGAGVTPETVDHASIERVARWLLDLAPPPSPHSPDPALVAEGREVYMAECAACHGHQAEEGYVFTGARLGTVEPNATLGVDPARLDSYTPRLREAQLTLFEGTPYRFEEFTKTDGYANLPLDGLWLRGPYLHNGAVPTLRALLEPPAARPAAFVRGLDVVDGENGGFVAPACVPGEPLEAGFCFDTRLPGNGNGGHLYGTVLSAADKEALLAYLLTF